MNRKRTFGLLFVSVWLLVLAQPVFADSLHTESAQSCSGDQDCDGLSDYDEERLLDWFNPYFIFDEDENANILEETAFLYQVTPIRAEDYQFTNDYHFLIPDGAMITIVLAWTHDYGDEMLGIKDHWGDTEAMRMYIAKNPGGGWELTALLIKRHYDDPEGYVPDEFEYKSYDQSGNQGWHPIVWVSADKHAMYSSWEECEDYSVGYEYCGGQEIGVYSDWLSFNVGERYDQNFDFFPSSGFDELVWRFPNDYAWSDFHFCGGHPNPSASHSECVPGSLNGKWWPPQDLDDLRYQMGKIERDTTAWFSGLYGSAYTVWVDTGDVDRAGTDGDVFITLFGDAGSYGFVELDTPDYDDFERGDQDAYDFGVRDIGNVETIRLWHYALGDNPDWFLDGLRVTDNWTGREWECPFFQWISANQTDETVDLSCYPR